jgi:hypothetical protein
MSGLSASSGAATFGRHEDLAAAFRLIIFPHAQACVESKLLSGRLERRVLKRDHFLCMYEGCVSKATTVDHIVPSAVGGMDERFNYVLSCRECNVAKGSSWPTCKCSKCKKALRVHWTMRGIRPPKP